MLVRVFLPLVPWVLTSAGTSCPSQRPTSSVIATTALHDIPGQCVAQAISFLGERDKLTDWLAQKPTKIALWRQGVDEPGVLAATAEVRYLHGDESRHSPHTRYATQLLAQIAWEAELLNDSTPRSSEAFATVNPPPPDAHSMPVRGSKTSTQRKRPASAGRPSKKPNLEQENIILQRWEEKLAFAFQLKAQRKKEVEIKAREQNSKIEAVRKTHAKLLKESEELQYHKWQGRTKDHNDKIARNKFAKQEVCELMMNAAAARQAVLETNRRRLLQEQAERQAKRMEQETERQTNAEKKRQDVRNEKCVGKPRMRVAREISRKQALRLERIRFMEREDLRQRLQSRSPTATPSPRPSRPSSARTVSSFVPMPPSRPASRPNSRPTSAQKHHRAETAVPDPSCIPLPRCARPNPGRPGRPVAQGNPRGDKGNGCRSAPAGIAIARGQMVHDQTTIDPLGIFPVDGFRCVHSHTTVEIDTSDAAMCFKDLVRWAWEDDWTETRAEGATFLTEMDFDKDLEPGLQILEPPVEQNASLPETAEFQLQTAQTSLKSAVEPKEASQDLCTCDDVDLSNLVGLSTAEAMLEGGDGVHRAETGQSRQQRPERPDRPESVRLTTSSETSDSSA